MTIRRRDFITLLGGAAGSWPVVARAQQSAMPVIGFLDSRSSAAMGDRLGGFRQGLKELGFAEGENVAVAYRWAEDRLDRLPEMAAELVSRQPTVIVTTGGPATAMAAKAATTTIPIVFLVGEDPTRLGLVSSIARPSNLTGINLFTNELEAKRLELLHQLVPEAKHIAVLVNPADVTNTENTLREVGAAARATGLQVHVLKASTARGIDEAFAAIGTDRPDALFVGSAAFLNIRRAQLVQLATFHRLPATFSFREATEAGALMSYGPSIADAYRQWAVYAARILKGAKPADLPVIQASKFELVINLLAARLLGLTLPPTRGRLAELATRNKLPVLYPERTFVEAGGLMSYGSNRTDAYREAGIYAGRILRGEKPSDMPVIQASKFELVSNLKTAKALGVAIPPSVLAIADEVIE